MDKDIGDAELSLDTLEFFISYYGSLHPELFDVLSVIGHEEAIKHQRNGGFKPSFAYVFGLAQERQKEHAALEAALAPPPPPPPPPLPESVTPPPICPPTALPLSKDARRKLFAEACERRLSTQAPRPISMPRRLSPFKEKKELLVRDLPGLREAFGGKHWSCPVVPRTDAVLTFDEKGDIHFVRDEEWKNWSKDMLLNTPLILPDAFHLEQSQALTVLLTAIEDPDFLKGKKDTRPVRRSKRFKTAEMAKKKSARSRILDPFGSDNEPL